MIRQIAFLTQVLFASSVSLLTQASRGHGDYRYNTLTVPMYAEVLKLVLSLISLFSEYNIHRSAEVPFEFKFTNFLGASVPAVLYLITNNLNFFVIKEIGALSFQILNNLKIVTAAILFQLALKKPLSPLKWRAIILLTIGSLISQLKDCIMDGSNGFNGSFGGYAAQFLTCWLSAAASVYCEVYLKNTKQSIHWQNAQLYIWGLLLSIFALIGRGDSRGIAVLWDGHDFLSLLLTCSIAFCGLATAFVLKYLDNIAKNFAVVAAMFVAAIASVLWLNEKFTLHLGIGLAIASIATDLYVRDKSTLAMTPPPATKEMEHSPLLDKNQGSRV
uniref:Solute carrier family 35 (UDP-sugar transporter), member A1/2/3 n=1 Tax=Tetraselmis sp. GSL018 TaxID=582737 RepID=A0A061S4W8_9CHLO